MKERGNMVSMFVSILSRFGGSMPIVEVEKGRKKHSDGRRKFSRGYHPVNGRDYLADHHGTIHRRVPKRNKALSARQWKKKRHAERMAAKEGTL